MLKGLRKFIIGEPPSEEIRERARRKSEERQATHGKWNRVVGAVGLGWCGFVVIKVAGGGIIADLAFIPLCVLAWFFLKAKAKKTRG